MDQRLDECPACEGFGLELCRSCWGNGDMHGGAVTCSGCGGEGTALCLDCEGTGGPVWVEMLDDGTRGRIAPASEGL